MIGVVSTIAHGRCRHCGGAISLSKSDLERDWQWYHAPVDGVGRRECPGTLYAAPRADEPIDTSAADRALSDGEATPK